MGNYTGVRLLGLSFEKLSHVSEQRIDWNEERLEVNNPANLGWGSLHGIEQKWIHF